jgi:hypothetical protein
VSRMANPSRLDEMHPLAQVTLLKHDLSSIEAAVLSLSKNVASNLIIQTVEQRGVHLHDLSFPQKGWWSAR